MTPEQVHAEACNVLAAVGHAVDYDDEVNTLTAALLRAEQSGYARAKAEAQPAGHIDRCAACGIPKHRTGVHACNCWRDPPPPEPTE